MCSACLSLTGPATVGKLPPASASLGKLPSAFDIAAVSLSANATVHSIQPQFKLASSFPPIPAKLVAKVRSLAFIDMKEFLPDNIGLLKNLESLDNCQVSGLSPAARPKLREVRSLLTWVSCFTTYTAILAESHPHLVHQRLAYMATIVREARRNGGDGWKAYDTIFRQNASGNASVDWSQLDPALHSTTFLAQKSGFSTICSVCFDCDHSAKDCGLSSFAPNHSVSASFSNSVKARFNAAQNPICISWNKGACMKAPNCRYRHSCAICSANHPACSCPDVHQGSMFKRQRSSNPSS